MTVEETVPGKVKGVKLPDFAAISNRKSVFIFIV